MKLLKKLILFSLASELDFWHMTEGYNYKPYSYLYWLLGVLPREEGLPSDSEGYKPSSIRDACLKLVFSGDLDKIIRNGVPLFRLTSRGRERLLSFFPISIGQKRVWDRIWRIVILNSKLKVQNSKLKIKEFKELRKLKYSLKKLGFKKLSRGVYLTPLPISAQLRELLLACNITAHIAVIESRRLLFGDDKQLAKHVWNLESLEKTYSEIIKSLDKLLSILTRHNLLINQEKINIFPILKSYYLILEADPGLPRKLLTDDWPADKAKEKYFKLMQLVANFSTKENRR